MNVLKLSLLDGRPRGSRIMMTFGGCWRSSRTPMPGTKKLGEGAHSEGSECD